MVKCYTCGADFEPDAAALKAWAESSRPFWPDEWQCNDCREGEAVAVEKAEAGQREPG